MTQPPVAIGGIVDSNRRYTWLTPEAARLSGGTVGMRAGANPDLPWSVTRRYVEALDRCLESGLAVAWVEGGRDGQFAYHGQVFPLQGGRGALLSLVPLDSIPTEILLSELDRRSEEG